MAESGSGGRPRSLKRRYSFHREYELPDESSAGDDDDDDDSSSSSSDEPLVSSGGDAVHAPAPLAVDSGRSIYCYMQVCNEDEGASIVAVSEDPFADVENGTHRANHRRRRKRHEGEAPYRRDAETWTLDMAIGAFSARDTAYSAQNRWKNGRGVARRRELGVVLSNEFGVECYTRTRALPPAARRRRTSSGRSLSASLC